MSATGSLATFRERSRLSNGHTAHQPGGSVNVPVVGDVPVLALGGAAVVLVGLLLALGGSSGPDTGGTPRVTIT